MRGRVEPPARQDENYDILGHCPQQSHIRPQPRNTLLNAPLEPHAPTRKLRMHQDSSQISRYINPSNTDKSQAGKPNFKRSNIAAIKEQSQINALKKLPEAAAAAARSRPRTKPQESRPSSSGGRDFVAENRQAAAAAPLAPGHKNDADAGERRDYMAKEDYGKVPAYLSERKQELAADFRERQAAKERELVPPGMRIMPEEERLATLAILGRNREEVTAQISRLPFVIETPSQRRHQSELEARMKEIEEAERIFSKSKVLVHES